MSRTSVIPALVYRNAAEAIEWLCGVIGFHKHVVYTGDDGGVAHAELTLGGGMIMIGTVNDGEFGRHVVQPSTIQGKVTQAPFIHVPDADVVYERVIAAGAEILIPIKDQTYGGREFLCRDPEGHLWCVGTYDPWAPKEDATPAE